MRGFAFVDLCHKRYDVVLMNPPFGLGLKKHYSLMKSAYPDGYVDIYSCFLSRSSELCTGRIGFISSRSFLLTKKLVRLRRGLILPKMMLLLDLGWSVMDAATVQSCACVLDVQSPSNRFIALDRKEVSDKSQPFGFEGKSESIYLVARTEMISLPQSIGQLSELTDLNLRYNQLSSLPESFSNLGNLRFLDLRANQLTSLPEGLGSLPHLKKLDLRWNRLATLPDFVARLQARGSLVYF